MKEKGFVEGKNLEDTFDFIQKVIPAVKRIWIIYNSSEVNSGKVVSVAKPLLSSQGLELVRTATEPEAVMCESDFRTLILGFTNLSSLTIHFQCPAEDGDEPSWNEKCDGEDGARLASGSAFCQGHNTRRHSAVSVET